eukprot:SM000339S12952  [mRNA]  locus=s339:84258:86369:+ [translate_table: standard]
MSAARPAAAGGGIELLPDELLEGVLWRVTIARPVAASSGAACFAEAPAWRALAAGLSILAAFPGLTELRLCLMGGSSLAADLAALEHTPRLRRLTLQGSGCAGLCSGLTRLTALESLALDSLLFGDEDLRIITSLCRRLTRLKLSELKRCGQWSGTSIKDEGLRHVAANLQQLRVLELADISTITAAGVLQIAAACSQLQSVQLMRCPGLSKTSPLRILAERPFHIKLVSDQIWIMHLRNRFQDLPELAHLEEVSLFVNSPRSRGEPDVLGAFITSCPRLNNLSLEGAQNDRDAFVRQDRDNFLPRDLRHLLSNRSGQMRLLTTFSLHLDGASTGQLPGGRCSSPPQAATLALPEMLPPPKFRAPERQFLSFEQWCPSLTFLSILGSRSQSPSRINSKTLVEMLSNLSFLVGLELDGSKYDRDDWPSELEFTAAPYLLDAWSSLKLDSVRSLSYQRMYAQHVHHLFSACSQLRVLHVQGCAGIHSTVHLDDILSTCSNICEIGLGTSRKFLGCRVPLTRSSRKCYLELVDSSWRLSTFFSFWRLPDILFSSPKPLDIYHVHRDDNQDLYC